ncbi:MAG: hypothetical protein EPO40_07895 [Myxococcaceae bacterium]|nr:MAG: hypothetical protein EPO40_07895 [Myxococcaceae bacterium]
MGKTAKIILAIVGIFILACLVGSVLLARFGKQKFGEVVQEAQRQSVEARAWARTHSQGDCINEGMSRVQACPGIQCQLAVQTFTSTCLSAASRTPDLCVGVPAPQDFMGTSQWINTRCAAFNGPQSAPGEPSMRCRNLLPVLQRHCFAQVMIASPDAAVSADAAAP